MVIYGILMVPIVFFVITSASIAAEDFQGAYSGEFSGDEEGIWIAIINGEGDIRFVLWSYDTRTVEGGEEISVNEGGSLDGQTTVNDWFINGYVGTSGSLMGKWREASKEGILEGLREDHISHFAGDYSGGFDGDESGEWDLRINLKGYASCTFYRVSGNVNMKGGVDSSGTVILYEDNGWGMTGTISEREINGEWSYPAEGKKGSIFRDETVEGEIGGCFIPTFQW